VTSDKWQVASGMRGKQGLHEAVSRILDEMNLRQRRRLDFAPRAPLQTLPPGPKLPIK
jgi:hypothetical protein